jgi:hypothetical protein
VTGPAPAYPNVAPICYGGDIVRANNQVSASESRILEDDISDGVFAGGNNRRFAFQNFDLLKIAKLIVGLDSALRMITTLRAKDGAIMESDS